MIKVKVTKRSIEDRLMSYLQSYHFRPTKTNDRCRKKMGVSMENTQLFGYTHKMFTTEIGLSKCSVDDPYLYGLLVEYGKYLDPNFRFTKITLNKNNQCPPHRDSNNKGITMIKSLGEYTGGLLCLETGEKINLREKPFYFYGSEVTHWVEPFDGERYTIVYYNGLLLNKVRKESKTDKKVFEEMFKKHEYTKFFGQERGETWCDIGANIGAFTLRNQINAIETHSYEPEPNNFQILLENSWTPDKCHRCAVVAENNQGDVNLYLSKSDWNHTIARPVRGRDCISVPTISFADATRECDCVKMDIEGGELEIMDKCEMSGFKKLIIAYHINYDKCRVNLERRLAKLREHYIVQTTSYPDTEVLDFFPNEIMIYCSKRQ